MSRCKAALSLLCGLAFIVQLFERSITDPTKQRNNPLLRLLGTHNGYNNGVLLLTFSHALMNFSNLLDILHKQGDMSEEQEKLTEALTFCKDYRSEKEAAMAYDKAARIVLGPHTFTNFEEEDPKGSGASNIQSKYKGVIWSRKAKCWRVDTSLLVAD